MANSCYFTFPTIFLALKAEHVLKNTTFLFALIPVPRAISVSCGMALRCNMEEVESIRGIFNTQNLTFSGIYSIDQGKNQLLMDISKTGVKSR